MTDHIRQAISEIKGAPDRARVSELVGHVLKEVPRRLESLDVYELSFDLINRVEDPAERRDVLLEFAKAIPATASFLPLYSKVMESAIIVADSIEEHHRRTTELIKIAEGLPKTDEFLDLRLMAWRHALRLPERPSYREPNLKALARELPKECDYSFYRGYTLLGIAKQVPKKGPFLDLYAEAMKLAMDSAAALDEPYYRKYAFVFIAKELSEKEELFELLKKAWEEAYASALAIKDPFAKEHALVDLFQEIPKTPDFYPLIMDLLEKALSFFTVKSWMEDVELLEVVDYILSAEELGIKESKKKRFSREKYAKRIATEFEKLVPSLNDVRFVEILRPYTHVWIQPRALRDSVKKMVDHLESLKDTYHGREIERPVFLKDTFVPGAYKSAERERRGSAALPEECISIDLGASNTVVMRKKGAASPEFIVLGPISKSYDNTHIVPTVLSPDTNTIGTDVVGEAPIINIKQMLLEGKPRGMEYMERFLKVLYQHIKKSVITGGWFSVLSKGTADVIYVTVPIGFTGYKKALAEITRKVFRGAKTEFIEEPLAAAMGYQVAEKRDKVIMVVDFGGCTLDTMVVRLNMNEVHVVAKPERAQILGGHDIDVWLAEFLADKVGLARKELPYKLLTKAEELKIELSKKEEAPFEWEGQVVCTISRYELEDVLDKNDFYKFVDRSISYVLRKAEKVGLRKEGIEAVLLTGGSSQIPSFKDKIGHIFPGLRDKNLIYDHSPLSAVAEGAALYGTRDVVDRHLGMPYAVRYATEKEKDQIFSYSILLEKGESLPLEKTFRMTPAKKLGVQTEIFLELFEVPESLVARRWVKEEGIEFLKQELTEVKDIALTPLRTVTLHFSEHIKGDVTATLRIEEKGDLSIRYGEGKRVDSGIRLQ